MTTRRVVLALAVAVAASVSSQAQSNRWAAHASHVAEFFTSDRETWRKTNASLQRIWPSGTLAVEGGATNRGSTSEGYVAADVYRTLGRTTYVNVSAAVAPRAKRIARLNVLAEIYASPGAPWEASAGVRHLTFGDTQIALGTASLGRYDGDWLTRVRATATAKGRLAVSAVGSARYYVTPAAGANAQFVEVIAGRGQEAVFETEVTEIRHSWIVAARIQKPLSDTFGLTAGGGYAWDDDLSRLSADAGLTVRF